MRRISILMLFGAVISCGVGCQNNPPRGDNANRLETTTSTSADQRSLKANSALLIEFANQISESLAARLPGIPAIANNPTRVLIELGDIQNATDTPSSDFSVLRRRMFLSMVNNPQITNTAQINESPGRADRQARGLGQDQAPDLMDEGTGGGTPRGARYNLEDTYVLNGTFGEIRRGSGQSTYVFDITLTNVGSREIVFVDQFEFKQVR